MMDPLHWLDALSGIAAATSCRIAGRKTALDAGLAAVAGLLRETRAAGGSVWWVGNGGSCAMCSHLSQDVMNKLGLRSQVLSDPSLMTCMANDFGYAEVYARPLARLARPGDLLIAISSSGNSPNILACADYAAGAGLRLVTLSAFDPGNQLWARPADAAFHLSFNLYGLAEVGHEALLHAAIECLFLSEQQKRGA
jgi:D-sedoheptulose 7-phosphate isomerase